MKKVLFFIPLFILMSTNCFASPAVHLVDSSDTYNLSINSSGELSTISNTYGKTLAYNSVVVASGSAVALGSSDVYSVTIKARSTNTSPIYLGGTSVSATAGYEMVTSSVVTVYGSSLGDMYALIPSDVDANRNYLDFIGVE